MHYLRLIFISGLKIILSQGKNYPYGYVDGRLNFKANYWALLGRKKKCAKHFCNPIVTFYQIHLLHLQKPTDKQNYYDEHPNQS